MLKLFNTYSNTIEEFKPINGNHVNMYVCGPTVYDHPHLGHARCYITWDVVYRYLKFLGYDVKYCRNVTDVDDKILNKSVKENCTPDEIAKKYYDILLNESDKKLGTTFNSGALVEVVVKSLYGSDDRNITSKGKIDMVNENIEIKATLTANTPARVQGLINSKGLDNVIVKFITYKGCYTFTVKDLKKAYKNKCGCFKNESKGVIKLKAVNLPSYFKADKKLNEMLGY